MTIADLLGLSQAEPDGRAALSQPFVPTAPWLFGAPAVLFGCSLRIDGHFRPSSLPIAQAIDASVRAKLPRHCIHLHAKPKWTIPVEVWSLLDDRRPSSQNSRKRDFPMVLLRKLGFTPPIFHDLIDLFYVVMTSSKERFQSEKLIAAISNIGRCGLRWRRRRWNFRPNLVTCATSKCCDCILC